MMEDSLSLIWTLNASLCQIAQRIDAHLLDLERMSSHAYLLLHPKKKKKETPQSVSKPIVSQEPEHVEEKNTRTDDLKSLLSQMDALLNKSWKVRGETAQHLPSHSSMEAGKREEKVNKGKPITKPKEREEPPKSTSSLEYPESFKRQLKEYHQLESTREENAWSEQSMERFRKRLSPREAGKEEDTMTPWLVMYKRYQSLHSVVTSLPREYSHGGMSLTDVYRSWCISQMALQTNSQLLKEYHKTQRKTTEEHDTDYAAHLSRCLKKMTIPATSKTKETKKEKKRDKDGTLWLREDVMRDVTEKPIVTPAGTKRHFTFKNRKELIDVVRWRHRVQWEILRLHLLNHLSKIQSQLSEEWEGEGGRERDLLVLHDTVIKCMERHSFFLAVPEEEE
ncbi:hypothetical protein PROFUN_11944 [Planoprotostelium fungivorum]|uniref:Uncharacterized protein n=1 Tax=Planoprotostelium fungivorum TaxID=1890364 RepID=A0A2P6N8W1_9EUKA|nr:hypothetical protein PROFUN_11944 [Planoprotostelium fungivorum]